MTDLSPTDVPPLPPDLERLAGKIATDLHIPHTLAALAILILVDDKIGDKIQIAGIQRKQVRLRDDFPIPGLLETVEDVPAVQQLLAGINPKPGVIQMSPEAKRLWDKWTEERHGRT
jgi:hypothetical protein